MRKERTAETKEVLHRFYVSVYERVREGGGKQTRTGAGMGIWHTQCVLYRPYEVL